MSSCRPPPVASAVVRAAAWVALLVTLLPSPLAAAAVTAAAAPATTSPTTRRHGWQVLRLPDGRDSVTLQLSRAGPLLLARGAIDGVDAGWFVVDTGASGILVDPAVAKRFDLKSIGQTRAAAIGGEVQVETATSARFELRAGRDGGDDAARVGVDRPVINIGSIAGVFRSLLGVDIAGLAGSEVLAGGPFALDFRDETLTFHRPGTFKPPATTRPHELRMVKQTPAVRLALEGRVGWFEIDTGSMGRLDVSSPFLAYARDLLDGKRVMSSISFGVGGQQNQFYAPFTPVTLLGRTIHDEVDASYSLSSEEMNFRDVQRAGRIGTLLLRDARVTFDYASRQVWAEWREAEPTAEFVARAKARAARSLTKETAVLLAASRGRADALRELLDADAGSDGKADVNAADAAGFTPLMGAARDSDECARLLIERGADVNAQAAMMALAPLHFAASGGQLETVKRLLAAGADVNVRTTLNQTPLLRAAEGRWLEVAAALLDAGADAKIGRKTGETPLMLAAGNGDLAMIALLLDRGRADVNQKTDDGRTALVSAVVERKPAAVKLLLSRGAAVTTRYAPSTPLHVAAMHGDAESAALLVAAGADLTAKDREGKTPLDRAVASGTSTVVRVLLDARDAATRP